MDRRRERGYGPGDEGSGRGVAERRLEQASAPRIGGSEHISLSVNLPARLESVARARMVLDHLDRIVPDATLDDLRLLVSELVTNSLIHSGIGAGQSIGLRLAAGSRGVRVEVADDGPGFPERTPAKPGPERLGGRGLWLVDFLANRWGVLREPRTCVWLEIDLPAPLH